MAEFSAWFEAYAAERFDAAIKRDAESGALKLLAQAAKEAFRDGRAKTFEALRHVAPHATVLHAQRSLHFYPFAFRRRRKLPIERRQRDVSFDSQGKIGRVVTREGHV